jgi:hypothetical protein
MPLFELMRQALLDLSIPGILLLTFGLGITNSIHFYEYLQETNEGRLDHYSWYNVRETFMSIFSEFNEDRSLPFFVSLFLLTLIVMNMSITIM